MIIISFQDTRNINQRTNIHKPGTFYSGMKKKTDQNCNLRTTW